MDNLLTSIEAKIEEIAENMASSQSLSMINGEEMDKHAGDLSASSPDWKNLCNDIETYFNVNAEINQSFINRLEKLKTTAKKKKVVTKKIIDNVKILVHEIKNDALVHGVL